jgi:hypothetical protein
MKLFIVMLLLLFAVPCKASDWSNTDTALEVTYAAVHVADWLQTRWISENHIDKQWSVYDHRKKSNTTYTSYHQESNPFLGRNPSKKNVDAYFASTLVAHAAISYLLPKDYRPYWQAITIALEGSVVGYNINAGVGISF